jgi:glycerophosphoryl diester phosphodiesterase
MTRVYAHRGASAEAPENTLFAFHKAIELGADALELDVHMTKDGAVLICHDPDGARQAGVGYRFCDVLWSEVKTWDAGFCFRERDGSRPFVAKGFRMMQLQELLEEFPQTPLNIDLKVPIAEQVVSILRKQNAEGRVCLASFQDKTLQRVRQLGYTGLTSLSEREAKQVVLLPALVQRGMLRAGGKVAQFPVSMAKPWVVKKLRKLGLQIDFWTINEPEVARQVLALHVDGIMTDDPRTIVPVVKSWR